MIRSIEGEVEWTQSNGLWDAIYQIDLTNIFLPDTT